LRERESESLIPEREIENFLGLDREVFIGTSFSNQGIVFIGFRFDVHHTRLLTFFTAGEESGGKWQCPECGVIKDPQGRGGWRASPTVTLGDAARNSPERAECVCTRQTFSTSKEFLFARPGDEGKGGKVRMLKFVKSASWKCYVSDTLCH
jgi:hypothetical protein